MSLIFSRYCHVLVCNFARARKYTNKCALPLPLSVFSTKFSTFSNYAMVIVDRENYYKVAQVTPESCVIRNVTTDENDRYKNYKYNVKTHF